MENKANEMVQFVKKKKSHWHINTWQESLKSVNLN